MPPNLDILDRLDEVTQAIRNNGGSAPLINETKQGFVFRRWFSTVTGGLVFVHGQRAGRYWGMQLLLFLYPAVITAAGVAVSLYGHHAVGIAAFSSLLAVVTMSILLIRERFPHPITSKAHLIDDADGTVSDIYLYNDAITFASLFSFFVSPAPSSTQKAQTLKQTIAIAEQQKRGFAHAASREAKNDAIAASMTGVDAPRRPMTWSAWAFVAVRSLASGLLCAPVILIISNFMAAHSDIQGALAFLAIFTLTVAHFGILTLNVPEPLPFTSHGTVYAKIDWFSRPFIVALLCMLGELLQQHHQFPNDQARATLLAVVATLPLMWAFALVPSISPLFLYLCEQLNVLCFGGSTTPSLSSLLASILLMAVTWGIMLGMWLHASSPAALISEGELRVAYAAISGVVAIMLASQHPRNLLIALFRLCRKKGRGQVHPSLGMDIHPTATSQSATASLQQRSGKTAPSSSFKTIFSVFHVLFLLMAAIAPSVLVVYVFLENQADTIGPKATLPLLAVACVLLFVNTLTTALQATAPQAEVSSDFPLVSDLFSLFALLINPFHQSTQTWASKKMGNFIADFLSLHRIRMLMRYAALVLNVTVFTSLSAPSTTAAAQNYTFGVVFSLFFLRGIRVSFQRPLHALLVHALLLLVMAARDVYPQDALGGTIFTVLLKPLGPWETLTFPLQAFIASFMLTRLRNFWQRLKFIFVVTATAFTKKEHRIKAWKPLLAVVALLSPLTLALALASAVLDVPLVPVFGLPLFVLASLRPKGVFPTQAYTSVSYDPDSVYYEAAHTSIASAVRRMWRCGVLGEVYEGQMLLLRFENRTAIVTVVEAAFDFFQISIKGLELVETSCHTVEATMLETIIENTWPYQAPPPTIAKKASSSHGSNSGNGGIVTQPWMAKGQKKKKTKRNMVQKRNANCDAGLLQTYLPLTQTQMNSYTDTKNTLTGVLTLSSMPSMLRQCVEYALFFLLIKKHARQSPQKTSSARNANTTASAPKNKGAHDDLGLSDSWGESLLGGLGKRQNGVDFEGFSCHLREKLSPEAVSIAMAPTTAPDNNLREEGGDKGRISTASWDRLVQAAKEDAEDIIRDFFANKPPVGVYVALHQRQGAPFLADADTSRPSQPLLAAQRKFDESISDEQRALIHTSAGFALKLAIDFAAIYVGEEAIDSSEEAEIAESLIELGEKWFIGPEGPEWMASIKAGVAFLFTVYKADDGSGTYCSHLVTTRLIPLYIFSLNHQVVHGLWMNLLWELLYLTNDDEERYSIQAHTGLLRNIVTQAAAPPLGYPIYAKITALKA